MCLNEKCSKVRVSKNLSGTFLVQIGLKRGDALLPLLSNFLNTVPSGRSKKTRKDWN
jgi:hypothetical protein